VHVEFWFDPICPFCWMTSRWIRLVAPERDLEITWRPISLLFKNEMTEEYPFFERATASLALLRVVEAARVRVGDAVVGDLYTEFGRAIHQRQAEVDLAGVLAGLGLDADLADAATDAAWDDVIRAHMADALDLAGNDVGVPIIAVEGATGRVGLFGPVLTTLPDPAQRLRLWDGFVAMADTPGFFELKRSRTSAPEPIADELV